MEYFEKQHKDLLAACEKAKKIIYGAINKKPASLSISIAYHILEAAIAKAGVR